MTHACTRIHKHRHATPTHRNTRTHAKTHRHTLMHKDNHTHRHTQMTQTPPHTKTPFTAPTRSPSHSIKCTRSSAKSLRAHLHSCAAILPAVVCVGTARFGGGEEWGREDQAGLPAVSRGVRAPGHVAGPAGRGRRGSEKCDLWKHPLRSSMKFSGRTNKIVKGKGISTSVVRAEAEAIHFRHGLEGGVWKGTGMPCARC